MEFLNDARRLNVALTIQKYFQELVQTDLFLIIICSSPLFISPILSSQNFIEDIFQGEGRGGLHGLLGCIVHMIGYCYRLTLTNCVLLI